MGDGRNKLAEVEAHLDVRTAQFDRAMRELNLALDEKERLLDLLEGSQKDIDERDAEIDRLRAALDEQRRQVSLLNGHDTLAQFQAHIAELEEEIDRLRAALRDILSRVDHETAYQEALYAVSNIARKALGET